MGERRLYTGERLRLLAGERDSGLGEWSCPGLSGGDGERGRVVGGLRGRV